MEVEKSNSSSASPADSTSAPVDSSSQSNTAASRFSASNFSSWAKNFKFSQSSDENAESSDGKKSALGRIASGLGIRTAVNTPAGDKSPGEASPTAPTQDGAFGVITKGFLDTSKNAMRAVQLKARHMVSQNKRRYQEDGFDLDLTYITENIIAMGFPAGDSSSGILGYVEGFYRNHMEEVIRFFESHHKGKYKVYNLCSERLYDASLLEGKVASFPFDDHNCPPIQLIVSFCQSAYSWLKEDIENIVVVHCKAGMARTGLMISSLLLYLKFYPTAEESMEYYNQKRCVDGKGLVLPSQIRYVKYFERVLTYFNGEVQPGRRCVLRGFRFHRCPYWVRPSITVFDHNGVLFSTKKHPRTKDMMPEDFWFSAPRKGIMVFALPGERGLAELNGDFKVLFHDRNGDFYCWLNTSMMENRQILNTSELDGFDKRKLPCPGFQVEVVLMDADAPAPSGAQEATVNANSGVSVPEVHPENTEPDISDSSKIDNSTKDKESLENEDIFSDSEGEDNDNAHTQMVQKSAEAADTSELSKESVAEKNNMANISNFVSTCQISSKDEDSKTDTTKVKDHMIDKKNTSSNVKVGEQLNLRNAELTHKEETKTPDRESESDFKPIGADASVFTFGDEEDYESD